MPEDVDPRNTLNDLSGERFLYFTKSVLHTTYRSEYGHELRKAHGANKPPRLMAALIEFFTKSGMRVLDPFAGVGGTLIGASIATPKPRSCVGIEIAPHWAAIYRQVLEADQALTPQPMIVGDCRAVMDRWLAEECIEASDGTAVTASADDPFDFIVMDPPYNIHLPQTMSGRAGERYLSEHPNRGTDYCMASTEDGDLANLPNYDRYLDAMAGVFERCLQLLRPGRYMAIISRDAYQNSEYIFTHVDLARSAQSAGFVTKGEIVWYQSGAKLRPYGYPFSYVPNIMHQDIVVLQRPGNARKAT